MAKYKNVRVGMCNEYRTTLNESEAFLTELERIGYGAWILEHLQTINTRIVKQFDYREKRIDIFLPDRNDYVQYWTYMFSYYELKILNLVRQLVGKKATYLDVGAYIGTHSLYYSIINEAAQVYAFEPNPSSIRMLRENLQLNDIQNVQVIERAAWDTNSLGNVSSAPPHNAGISVVSAAREGNFILIPLDECLEIANETIDCIKIDVEGNESKVLAGAEAIICRDCPVLDIEIHTNEYAFPAFLMDIPYKMLQVQACFCNHVILSLDDHGQDGFSDMEETIEFV